MGVKESVVDARYTSREGRKGLLFIPEKARNYFRAPSGIFCAVYEDVHLPLSGMTSIESISIKDIMSGCLLS